MSKPQPGSASIQGVIFDVDGVLWRGEYLLPGAKDLLRYLSDTQIPYAFATNNATKTPDQISAEGQMRGLEMSSHQVLTSSMAAVSVALTHLQDGSKIFVIGEQGLIEPLSKAGFELLPSANGALAVVVGLDREISWDKLSEAAYAIEYGALFIGTNADLSLPTERGFAPGNGAILQALEVTTGVSPTIVGKPDPHLFQQALEKLSLNAENTLVIGDRLETDILGGIRAGIQTSMVLTGASTLADLERSTFQPDFIYQDLVELRRDLWGTIK